MRRLSQQSANEFAFKSNGDVASTKDLNSQNFKNSVFYALNPSNAPHSNNGVALYLSASGMPGATSSQNLAEERAAQLYFGDTPLSGLFYRVKQGASGWNPWVSLATGMRCVGFSSTDAHTYTTSQSGFTTLETTFTRVNAANTSRFLILATINGAADDDAHATLQFYDGSGWGVPDALVGSNMGDSNARGSFGDFSIVRTSVMENKQNTQFTACILHAPKNGAGTLGYRVQVKCENSAGCYINRPMGNDGGFNTNSSRSTLLVFEVTGQMP